ncbi:hypothetical protein HBI71_004930 [Parastagonospora nodorum]|nr:hypothetical protein HBI71_004930 [Parastagonospora nodorum]KAH5414410.1 hypothetical protein HBI47_153270 [Parastagonospora nodorum]
MPPLISPTPTGGNDNPEGLEDLTGDSYFKKRLIAIKEEYDDTAKSLLPAQEEQHTQEEHHAHGDQHSDEEQQSSSGSTNSPHLRKVSLWALALGKSLGPDGKRLHEHLTRNMYLTTPEDWKRKFFYTKTLSNCQIRSIIREMTRVLSDVQGLLSNARTRGTNAMEDLDTAIARAEKGFMFLQERAKFAAVFLVNHELCVWDASIKAWSLVTNVAARTHPGLDMAVEDQASKIMRVFGNGEEFPSSDDPDAEDILVESLTPCMWGPDDYELDLGRERSPTRAPQAELPEEPEPVCTAAAIWINCQELLGNVSGEQARAMEHLLPIAVEFAKRRSPDFDDMRALLQVAHWEAAIQWQQLCNNTDGEIDAPEERKEGILTKALEDSDGASSIRPETLALLSKRSS